MDDGNLSLANNLKNDQLNYLTDNHTKRRLDNNNIICCIRLRNSIMNTRWWDFSTQLQLWLLTKEPPFAVRWIILESLHCAHCIHPLWLSIFKYEYHLQQPSYAIKYPFICYCTKTCNKVCRNGNRAVEFPLYLSLSVVCFSVWKSCSAQHEHNWIHEGNGYVSNFQTKGNKMQKHWI